MFIRILRSKLTTIGLIAIGALVGIRALESGLTSRQSEGMVRDLEAKVAGIEQENKALSEEMQAAQDPTYLERQARIRLNVQAPDETVVYVYKAEDSDAVSPARREAAPVPQWRKWLDWICGK
jgi:cell division protein FtsB